MQSKQSCLRDFDVLNKLGEGAFGQVYKVKRKADGLMYALKKIKLGALKPKQKQNALNQVRILASYNDQYIIGFKDSFYDESSDSLCVVMQFAEGGDILKNNSTHIKQRTKYKQQQIWCALVHMSKGLKSLHERKILHRDLKCANVFITANKVFKLGDLNVSKVLKKDFASTQTGTPYYASPEVWKDRPYDLKSDMWSLGCVLYEMAALRPPFTAHDLSGLYKKVCAGVFERIPYNFSNDLHNVISSLLKVEPKKRPDTEELLNNGIVQKKYNGEIEITTNQMEQGDQLLQTIKFNPKDLKGLKKNLPKANYDQEKPSEKPSEKIINSSRSVKKEEEKPKKIQFDEGQRKLKEYLEKKRQSQEKQREQKYKMIKDQNQQMIKNRQRVLSACGVRKQYVQQSPRIAVHKKDDIPIISNQNKSHRKQETKNVNLPPRPQGMGLNYKLPPKPTYNNNNNSNNRSVEMSQRDKSKENLRNLGAQIVNQVKPKQIMTPNPKRQFSRCSSAQKINYPAWWG